MTDPSDRKMSDHEDMPVRKKGRTSGVTEEMEKGGETSLIQNCKLDACADWLSSRLYSLKPDYFPGWKEREPKWEAFPENELKKVTEDLEQHVRRLVPGFLKDNEAVLKKKEFKDRLSMRWEPTLSGLRSGADKQDQDWVP